MISIDTCCKAAGADASHSELPPRPGNGRHPSSGFGSSALVAIGPSAARVAARSWRSCFRQAILRGRDTAPQLCASRRAAMLRQLLLTLPAVISRRRAQLVSAMRLKLFRASPVSASPVNSSYEFSGTLGARLPSLTYRRAASGRYLAIILLYICLCMLCLLEQSCSTPAYALVCFLSLRVLLLRFLVLPRHDAHRKYDQ